MRLNTYTNSKVTDYNVAEMGLEHMKIKNMDTFVTESENYTKYPKIFQNN